MVLSQFDRFQEWPQLLDPVLAALMQSIVDGFLDYISHHAASYEISTREDGPQVITLPLALSHLLYTLCKVRGYKVVVRLLNNEPRYVEPMLSCVRRWEASRLIIPQATSIVWEEKFIMSLWLSHLMLAPFELSTLSTSNRLNINVEMQDLARDLPAVAVDVLSLGFEQIKSPSKERESAVILLVRLALRKDMQSFRLSERLVDFATRKLLEPPTERQFSVYHAIGYLSLLYALVNLGTDMEVAPFLTKVFQASSTLSNSSEEHHASVRGSAPARKLLIKIQRVCLTHSITLSNDAAAAQSDTVNEMLEEGIQNYLDALADKDSPVRMAASKALSIITLKLDISMATEIVEAVLGGLSENILVEDQDTGQTMAKTDLAIDDSLQMKQSISLVDPLRWHGLMLTLGHLVFRRSPPAHQLPDVIEALLIGLEFEQRSNVGTSVGNAVRDAACFGIWALSRKYSTLELEAIKVQNIAGTALLGAVLNSSALQLVAVRLMLAACFDPSGNIRRGSSAALQELIGRHPDTIVNGIAVVQVVDYQAVARRSRAMTEVALAAAKLDSIYRDSLFEALLDWRGARAADADSRKWASITMGSLCGTIPTSRLAHVARRTLTTIARLKTRNLGATAGNRHGLLLAAAASLSSVRATTKETDSPSALAEHEPELLNYLSGLHLTPLTGDLHARASNELEMVMEAVAMLFQAIVFNRAHISRQNEMLEILSRCINTSTKSPTIKACASAIHHLLQEAESNGQAAVVRRWLDRKHSKRADMVTKGRLHAVALLSCGRDVLDGDKTLVISFLSDVIIGTEDAIETRITAMECLHTMFEKEACFEIYEEGFDVETLERALIRGLNDYTNDQRGDVGSLLRLASLDTTEALVKLQLPWVTDATFGRIIPNVVRLAAERLNKVRHRASACLMTCWKAQQWQPTLSKGTFGHLADISSEAYFAHLLPLLEDERVRTQLIRGLAFSATGTSEEVGRACCSALARHVLALQFEELVQFRKQLLEGVVACLDSYTDTEDHNTLPILDFCTFTIEQELILTDDKLVGGRIWELVQKAHTPTASMERLDSLAKLYGAMLVFDGLRTKILDKLTRLLLHRYPKVRNAAADVLFLGTAEQLLVERDWNGAAASNKPQVLDLRKRLKIVKP